MFEKRMKNSFELCSDIEARLNRTVCLYDGEPYRVETDGHQMYLYDLLSKNPPQKIDAHDPLLDISSVEIGYMNFKPETPGVGNKRGFTQFVCRSPGKQWKQALCLDRLDIYSHTDGQHTFCTHVNPENIYDMVKGIYPSVVEAVWNLSQGLYDSIAISRDVALINNLTGTINLNILREPVGTLIPGHQKVFVKDQEYIWVIKKSLSRFNIEVDPFMVESI